MRSLFWFSVKFLVAISFVVLLLRPDLKAQVTGLATAQESQSLANRKGSTFMERDKLYNQLLETSERFEAVWNQQPGNLAALKRYHTELLKQVVSLRGFHEGMDSTAGPPPAKQSPAKTAVVKAPSGPVQPSTTPSSADEIRKRMEATEKFLKVPFGGTQKSRTLIGVSDTWIDTSCNLAEEEITNINNLLEVEPLDHDAMHNALKKLRTILYQVSNPPSSTPPVTPKGLEK